MIKNFILAPISIFYDYITYFRNLFYEIGFLKINQLPCKVISIGNLTVGGTGKTPTVIYMAKLLKKKGYKVGIISRGYKRITKGTVLVSDGIKTLHKWQEVGDEPFMMAKKLKNVPIAVDSNRYRAGLLLIKKFDTDIILMDDGFQHRKIHRDVDIVLINSLNKMDDYKLVPFGLLRESVSSLSRANFIIVTKSNLQRPSTELIKMIQQNTNSDVIESTYELDEISNGIDRKKLNNGKNITLTIDSDIQEILHSEISKGMELFSAKSANGIVLNPQNGNILAMVSLPDYNPNNYYDYDIQTYNNHSISSAYEPGSTYKIVTTALAVDSKIISLKQEFDCEGGEYIYSSKENPSLFKKIHDHEPNGVLSVEEILIESSNISTGIDLELNFPLSDIYGIPLIIKYPGTINSFVSNEQATVLDIVPTIYDVLDGKISSNLSGKSLQKTNIFHPKGKFEYHNNPTLLRNIELFNDHDISSIYKVGPNSELIGKSVFDFEILKKNYYPQYSFF